MPARRSKRKHRTLDRFDTTKANFQKKLPPIKQSAEDSYSVKKSDRADTGMNRNRTVLQNPRGLTLNSRQCTGTDPDAIAMIRNRGRKPLVVISPQFPDSTVIQIAKRDQEVSTATTSRKQRLRSSLDEKRQDPRDNRDEIPSNKVLSAGRQWTHITQQINVDAPRLLRYRKKGENPSRSRFISENVGSSDRDENAKIKPPQKSVNKTRKSTRVRGKLPKAKLSEEEIPSSTDGRSLEPEEEKDTAEIPEALYDGGKNRTASAGKETSTPSVRGSAKSTPSPKPMSTKQQSREPTPMSHINMSDFADFNLLPNSKIAVTSDSTPEYQHKLEKASKFKGASNRVPSGKDSKESGRKSVSQRLSGERSNSSRSSHADLEPPILVSKIQRKKIQPLLRPPVTLDPRYLAPEHPTVQQPNHLQMIRGESVESGVSQSTTSESLPRILFGSPPPAQSIGTPEEYTGEISIIVPKLPMLSISGPESTDEDRTKPTVICPSESEAGQSIEDESATRLTGSLSIKEQRDGFESGYSSMTPRLSVDSTGQALSPFSSTGSMLLEVPGGRRSLTPNSTSSSIFLDVANSRPQSSYLDARHLNPADQNNDFTKRLSSEGKPLRRKLPAIHSRNSDYDSTDENRLGFTPLPLQSVRTESDVELSDSER